MKEYSKKVVTIFLLILSLFMYLINIEVTAETVTEIIPSNNYSLGRKVLINGVGIMSDYSYNFTENELHLVVDGNSMNGVFAGFEAQIFFEGAIPTGEVEEKFGLNWNITSNIDYYNNCINIVVDPKDMNKIQDSAEIIIKYYLDVDSEESMAYINTSTFKETDLNSNIYNPIENFAEEMKVSLDEIADYPIVSKDENSVKVNDNNILVKLEGNIIDEKQGVIIKARDLIDKLAIDNESFYSILIWTENENFYATKENLE